MEDLVKGNGICDYHYLLTIRSVLRKKVGSPLGIDSIHDLGNRYAPRWHKPVGYAGLDAFFKSRRCDWLRQSIDVDNRRGMAREGEKAEQVIRMNLEQHGLTLKRACVRYGKRRASGARKWTETIAFFATRCSFPDIAKVIDRSVAQVSKEIYGTWCKDYYIGCVGNVTKLMFSGYLVRE